MRELDFSPQRLAQQFCLAVGARQCDQCRDAATLPFPLAEVVGRIGTRTEEFAFQLDGASAGKQAETARSCRDGLGARIAAQRASGGS